MLVLLFSYTPPLQLHIVYAALPLAYVPNLGSTLSNLIPYFFLSFVAILPFICSSVTFPLNVEIKSK